MNDWLIEFEWINAQSAKSRYKKGEPKLSFS